MFFLFYFCNLILKDYGWTLLTLYHFYSLSVEFLGVVILDRWILNRISKHGFSIFLISLKSRSVIKWHLILLVKNSWRPISMIKCLLYFFGTTLCRSIYYLLLLEFRLNLLVSLHVDHSFFQRLSLNICLNLGRLCLSLNVRL